MALTSPWGNLICRLKFLFCLLHRPSVTGISSCWFLLRGLQHALILVNYDRLQSCLLLLKFLQKMRDRFSRTYISAKLFFFPSECFWFQLQQAPCWIWGESLKILSVMFPISKHFFSRHNCFSLSSFQDFTTSRSYVNYSTSMVSCWTEWREKGEVLIRCGRVHHRNPQCAYKFRVHWLHFRWTS